MSKKINLSMFSNMDLKMLIIPLVGEQILNVAVGMADTMMVAPAGEAAVSGISLVNTICNLFLFCFSALATGGAVVASQYLGKKNYHNACRSADQLLISCSFIGVVLMLISLLFNYQILNMIYGSVDSAIMDNAVLYYYVVALSFPFLAIYNVCAALFRSMNNSKISLNASLAMNIVHIIGNALLIYVFEMGVAGVAISNLLSRVFVAVIMIVRINNQSLILHITKPFNFKPDFKLIKSILRIGIPNGLENSMFQVGKLLTQSLISSFGTAAIAANAVASNLEPLIAMPATAISLSMVTVVGQCVGANDYKQAKGYVHKLIKISYLSLIAIDTLIAIASPFILDLYNLQAQSREYAQTIILCYCVVAIVIYSLSFGLPSALRAAGDVRYTMISSISSMWIFRITLSFVFGRYLGLGVVGVWFAMFTDWFVRSLLYTHRFKSGKWMNKAVV